MHFLNSCVCKIPRQKFGPNNFVETKDLDSGFEQNEFFI